MKRALLFAFLAIVCHFVAVVVAMLVYLGAGANDFPLSRATPPIGLRS
jgi:hypothetical protein